MSLSTNNFAFLDQVCPRNEFKIKTKKGNILIEFFKFELAYNHYHIILILFEFYQIFFSPQVKRFATVSYKHGTYALPHELPNKLRRGILGNYKISGKS